MPSLERWSSSSNRWCLEIGLIRAPFVGFLSRPRSAPLLKTRSTAAQHCFREGPIGRRDAQDRLGALSETGLVAHPAIRECVADL
jgi:hypothetical protein